MPSPVVGGFADEETEKVWNAVLSRRLPAAIQQRALLKLRMLHAAVRLDDPRAPPANRLEASERAGARHRCATAPDRRDRAGHARCRRSGAALRLGRALGTSAEFWTNLHAGFDLEETAQTIVPALTEGGRVSH